MIYLLVVAAASLLAASVGPAAVQRPGRGVRPAYVPLPPFARLDPLRGDRAVEHDQFGTAVAISADGTVAVVGAPGENNGKGAVYLFQFRGSSWQSRRLVAGGEKGAANFGRSVAVSGSGRVFLVGGPNDNSDKGAAWIFRTHGGGTWVGQKLLGQRENGDGKFGASVALSLDGGTALIGAPDHRGSLHQTQFFAGFERGGAWIFTRSGDTWRQEAKLVGGWTQAIDANFGSSVALSGDGTEALIGGPNAYDGKGECWFFKRTGDAWGNRRQSFLPGWNKDGDSHYGASVALSRDGKAAIVGGNGDDSSMGAAWVSSQYAGRWVREAKLVSSRSLPWKFGSSVSISGDGTTALVGSPAAYQDTGGIWFFGRTGRKWKEIERAAGGSGFSDGLRRGSARVTALGSAVALSVAGDIALVGAPLSPFAGGKYSGNAFVLASTPRITSINPFSGPTLGGTLVTVDGAFFSGVRSVTFGSLRSPKVTIEASTRMFVVSPPGNPGQVHVRAFSPVGESTASAFDAFNYVARPLVNSLSPALGPPAGGNTVTVTGTGFTGATRVSFGTATASFKATSDSQILAKAPPGQGAVHVTVTTAAGGTSSARPQDLYTYGSAPVISSITPSTGPTSGGTQVTITGGDFTGASAVKFGATAATSFTVDSSSQIRAVAPPGQPGTVDIAVTTPVGTSAAVTADRFTYVSKPVITSISPTSGLIGGGTTVTITGGNLTGATSVKFGSVAATSFTVDSSTTITAVSPAEQPAAVDISVTTPFGTSDSSAADQFTYFDIINFDDLVTNGPGGSGYVHVTNQYAGRGVIFNSPSAIDYSKGSFAIPGFAHSGTVAVEPCIGAEFCTVPVDAKFSTPERTVCAWAGFSYRLDQPVQVQLQALNAASAVVGTATATLPANSGPTLIRTPLQVVATSATITELTISIPAGYNNAVAVDDVTFTSGPGPLAACS